MDLQTIQKRIESLDNAQSEVQKIKLLLEDALKEDATFQEIDLETREIAMKKKKVKDEVWGQPAYQEAMAKLKDIKEEVKDLQDILRHELLEYRQTNNTEEIILADGSTRKLKINIRLQAMHEKGE